FNLDAGDLIKMLKPELPQKCLVYFDPPYYKKGKMLYSNFYKHDDHAHMALLIKSLQCPWIVTYDNVPEIKNMYSGEPFEDFDISYSAHSGRPRGSEIMFYHDLNLPSAPYARKV
ncbi:MAG: hypothetical protein VR64_05540, partial [Desulfatitalea sp. BRH_c12]